VKDTRRAAGRSGERDSQRARGASCSLEARAAAGIAARCAGVRRSLCAAALAAAGLLAAPVQLPAERPFSATYDATRQIHLEGSVTRVEWVNPHAFLVLLVRDATGTVARWAVEIGPPLDLERAGWKRTSVQVGDVVAVDGVPSADDRRQAFARSVVLKRTGKPLFTRPTARRAASSAPAPRWPDGRVRLGPPPGGKGYWAEPSATVLVDRSAGAIRLNEDGLLVNLSDVDRVAPFRPWARALYEYRQRTRLRDDPLARCVPPGGPRQFQMPNGVQFIEQRELGRILVLHGGGDRNWRVIYTDGRPLAQAAELVLSYYGTSVGRWDGDTLVVESVGYNEKFWMTNGGLPHTEALHLTERFSRPNFDTLRYEVTVDDPRTYTRPWTGGWTLRWVPDREIEEYFCEENAESTFLR